MGNKTQEVCIVVRVGTPPCCSRLVVLRCLFGACPREEGNKQNSIEERVHILAGKGRDWSRRAEASVWIKRSKQWRSMMHKYMQVQSYLCQLGVEDLKAIAKDLGCSQNEVEGKKVGKKG